MLCYELDFFAGLLDMQASFCVDLQAYFCAFVQIFKAIK